MLCAVTSSARWWATSPLSEVFRPKKEEMPMALGLQVQGPEGDDRRRGRRGRGDLARRAVARVGGGAAAHQAGQVVEEGELLAHERAVDPVLAGDLGEQAAQL